MAGGKAEESAAPAGEAASRPDLVVAVPKEPSCAGADAREQQCA